ncbi:MAG: NAD(+) diphosphatase [Treponema sp.]|jgi:NAD+ diphosphatase|nr:NAD(+) diphosphatase [Treponema sp.]
MAGRVYLFQGNYLVIPETTNDNEAAGGVDEDLVRDAFGALACYAVPSPAAKNPAGPPGFLLPKEAVLPAGWRLLSVRQAAALQAADSQAADSQAADLRAAADPFGESPCPGSFASSVFRLYHVLQWREESRFCGSCGAANGDSPEELARLCPRCGRIEYPRISPAVITLVVNDRGEALLAHNRKFSENVYSLIAGFVEAGESLEDAAAREIREEVNISVKNLRFVTSQGWPFPNSLMVGFSARHAGGEIVCDGVEILDARWFSAESVRSGEVMLPHPGSVSLFIIKKWLAEEFGRESAEHKEPMLK